jgi:uncharacterized membrane protein YdjX (TVP38/TMEM64 family)
MSFSRFITQLDKKALRAIGVTMAMFALVLAMILLGRHYLGIDESTLQSWFSAVNGSAWALPVTILVFVLAAFIGVPQWALIAGAVVAFGPVNGALYSWGGTMVSASVDFMIGRAIGAERVSRYGGALVNRMVAMVRRNGFVTSFTVRLVPTGPFILVNMAAGVSRMTLPAFLGGTALGIIPKIAAVAFLGQSLVGALQGRPIFALGMAGLLALFIGIMLFARRRLKQREENLK